MLFFFGGSHWIRNGPKFSNKFCSFVPKNEKCGFEKVHFVHGVVGFDEWFWCRIKRCGAYYFFATVAEKFIIERVMSRWSSRQNEVWTLADARGETFFKNVPCDRKCNRGFPAGRNAGRVNLSWERIEWSYNQFPAGTSFCWMETVFSRNSTPLNGFTNALIFKSVAHGFSFQLKQFFIFFARIEFIFEGLFFQLFIFWGLMGNFGALVALIF